MGACTSQPTIDVSAAPPKVTDAGPSGAAALEAFAGTLARRRLNGATSASADANKAIINVSVEELRAALTGLDDASRKKMSAALGALTAKGGAPADVVLAKMKSFEEHYNADEIAKSAATYADACRVTVTVATAPSLVVFAGKTPEEVAGLLGKLRNDLKGTNIKFGITSVDGNMHENVWVADNGAGSCKATWEELGGDWKIIKNEIKFTPKAGGDNADGVPTEVVLKTMQAFEDSYNADNMAKSVEMYAAACNVVVNKGRVFAGKTPEEVAGFLVKVRTVLKATNIKFAVTKVEGKVHEDVWVTDNGAGSCKTTWEDVDGQWKIVKAEISFTPLVAA